VVLAAESRLRIPTDFNSVNHTRDLYLDGAAFFDVHHDSTRPFRVHTATGVAEDVGTAFVVTEYPETRGMHVVVASGVVAVKRGGGRDGAPPLLTVRAGNLARLDTTGTATLTRHVNVASYLAWTRGGLGFDGTPLREALPQIMRWYDLDLTLGDSALAERRITASFEDEPASRVIQRLALALGLRVEQRGTTTILYSRAPRRSLINK
jgi:ferric-dicitrate binding protein FerR (iron transport regulator)